MQQMFFTIQKQELYNHVYDVLVSYTVCISFYSRNNVSYEEMLGHGYCLVVN